MYFVSRLRVLKRPHLWEYFLMMQFFVVNLINKMRKGGNFFF